MTDQNDDPNNVGTTGHSWDGIEELNNPLPRWWVWTFYLTILWGVLYTVAYPAYPLIERATGGLLGYSTRAEVTKAIAAHDARNADLIAALGASGPDDLAQSPELAQYAVARGAAVFRTNCSQCHGAGAAGGTGYPNLLDDDWLWGGRSGQHHPNGASRHSQRHRPRRALFGNAGLWGFSFGCRNHRRHGACRGAFGRCSGLVGTAPRRRGLRR